MFAITEFLSTISNRGLASPAHYMVLIPQPLWNRGDGSNTVPDLRFLCSSVQLPGISMATSEIHHFGYGMTEKKPYAPVFGDIEMAFLSTADGRTHKFFHKWMMNIMNFSMEESIFGGIRGAPFFVSYPENYVVDIQIFTYDRKSKNILTVKLFDAYPIQINDIMYGYEQLNSIVQIPVKFTYRSWSSGVYPSTTRSTDIGDVPNELINRLMQSPAGQGYSGINYKNFVQTTVNNFNNDL